MKKLIVNADDFALHTLVNKAVIQAYQHGILTSTSILANGPAFDEAVQMAKSNPELGIGVHLCLVGGLETLSDPATVPTLIDPATGKLYSNYVLFTKQYLSGRVRKDEIYRELSLQFHKVKESGLNITHVDSHQHMHMLPGIDTIATRICQEHGLNKSRVSYEQIFFTGAYPFTMGRYIGKVALSFFSLLAARTFRAHRFQYPEHFYGMLAGGNMQEQYLLNILKSIPDGVSEIMMHPALDKQAMSKELGFNYNWQLEYEALISNHVREVVSSKGIQLISFKDL